VRIDPVELADLYRCPRCRLALSSLECLGCEIRFSAVGNLPVLVDFDASVLERDRTFAQAASSPVPGRVRRKRAPHPQVSANLRSLSGLLEPSSRVLVVGGGEDAHGLGDLTSRSDLVSITFDIYASDLTDFLADAHSIPLPDESVDCVAIQAVLEHVLDPWKVVDEIYRVLRPNGIVYAETPFMQQVHEGAYDFTRFTESGHRWLFRKFELIESGPIGGPIAVITWTNEYLLRGLKMPTKIRSVFRRIAGLFARFDPALNRRINADSASAVYFLGRKNPGYPGLSPADVIAFYSRRRDAVPQIGQAALAESAGKGRDSG
jgi:SAM-dependent methyltransferase